MVVLLWIGTLFVGAIALGLCKGHATQPDAEKAIRWTLGLAVVLIGGSWWVYFSWANSPQREAEQARKECNNSTMAYVMSQDVVKKQLKSPATADFPYLSASGVSSVPDGMCNFSISAYVDSQNSFGASIRTYYTAEINFDRATQLWSATALNIQ